eukprot:TRINITY_DN2810_c0_g1_i1.p1 TRINITY_DN2810_c0_g1~~TRINITY_DN2810_c0_g1_i1.p1  ORF type:complete len:565 (+),score=139.22 TRINITY_DN2810_c0_g1_i1:188-1696(+)
MAATHRSLKFPADFKWGTATASYQIEGAWNEGGRGLSIWDTFSKKLGGDTGEIACDHYYRYRDDVKLMASLGLKNYRLSISWSRLQPDGRGALNPEGVAFYNDLINCLVEHGIEPMVTLYHWDLPAALHEDGERDGWLNKDIVQAYTDYARVCFELFGDRVKSWLTFNEPWCSCVLGYGTGEHAPGIKCEDGSKVYRAAHNTLLAHAHAVDLYRRDFQPRQGGAIGITLNSGWSEPLGDADPEGALSHAAAAHRSLMWSLGWFADPIWLGGDYPREMRERCGDKLPEFTEAEKKLISGSSDFLGLNHYASEFIQHNEAGDFVSGWGTVTKGGFFGDMAATSVSHPSWSRTDMGWNVVPWGFTELLLWCHKRYQPSGGIYVTENGCAVPEPTKELAVDDHFRVAYFTSYVAAMHEAIEKGADVRGYYAWSFLDNFEWQLGFSKRFGMVHVDYSTQQRTPKASAKWFASLVAANELHIEVGARFTDAATTHVIADATPAQQLAA